MYCFFFYCGGLRFQKRKCICTIGQMGYYIGGNFNIHIGAWSASPSVQVGRPGAVFCTSLSF